MQTIFIQVKCELGQSYTVANAASEVESVSEVYSTSGHYDLMMKCYLQDDEDVGHFVNERHPDPGRDPGHLHDHHIQSIRVSSA